MRKLNKDQKILLTMMALVSGAMFTADWPLGVALAFTLTALALCIYLMLRNGVVTIGRFTIGRISPPRSR